MIISPFAQASIVTPHSTAVVSKDDTISYQQLFGKIQSIALQLQQAGIPKKSKLACIGPNSIEMLVLYWACIEADILFFPISPRLPPEQVRKLCSRLSVSFHWCEKPSDKLDQLTLLSLSFTRSSSHAARQLKPAEAVNLMLTSGSSGTPKAAVHSLSNHIASATGAVKKIPLSEGHRWLLSLPLFHIGGLAILNRCALAGAAVVIREPNLSLSDQLTRDNISHLSLVEAQLLELLEQPKCLTSVDFLLLGGGAISASSLASLEGHSVRAFTSYGMTEMSSQITTAVANPDGSCGKVLPNRELRIQGGTIQVKGECLFLGYYDSEASEYSRPLTADGWFDTQDRAEFTHDKNLKILGRADNMFISGGENIQPEEVEAALKLLAQIDNAIVFPIDDRRFGKLPAAIIKYSQNISPLDQDFLDQHLEQHIARFKRPRRYYEWPNGIVSTGIKVQRSKVIEQATRTTT